jgi:hypothetical protein
LALEDIKSYGELPFVSSRTSASYPMISTGKEMNLAIGDELIKRI